MRAAIVGVELVGHGAPDVVGLEDGVEVDAMAAPNATVVPLDRLGGRRRRPSPSASVGRSSAVEVVAPRPAHRRMRNRSRTSRSASRTTLHRRALRVLDLRPAPR